MKRLKRILGVVLLLGLIGAGLWFRPAYTPPISLWDMASGKGASIASLEEVRLGGADQWILVRGQDRSKPIVLILHGDPGRPEMYMAHAFQRPLERDFTVVQWDRRGTGKSYFDDPDRPIRTSQEIADTVELIGLLQKRFGPRRVILVGHSYGSLIGAAVAQAHPELVRAYVGMGQVACTEQDEDAIQDSWLKQRAALRGDKTTEARATAGGAWNRRDAIMAYGGEVKGMPGPLSFAWMGLTAPEYTLADVINIQEGWGYDHLHTVFDGPALPLAKSIPALAVPSYFFQGTNDYLAPGICVDRYEETLQAPAKRMVWFQDSAHFPFLDDPEGFRRELVKVAEETSDRA